MSMQPIIMKVALFRGDFDQARSQYSLLWLMEALCRVNQSHIRQFRKLAQQGKVPAPYPNLYTSGVHYEPEAGTEEWLDIPNILNTTGGTFPGPWGDCEDLACWCVAEHREDLHNPINAKPFAKWRRKDDGSYAYHALVLLPDGQLEDPSLVLGMGNEPEFAKLQLAQKYKEGILKPQIRYAKAPTTVVVDPDSPSGYNDDIDGAKAATGLTPPPDAPITGMITGRTAKKGAGPQGGQWKAPPGATATDDEDGSAGYRGAKKPSVKGWNVGRSSASRGFSNHHADPALVAHFQRKLQRQMMMGDEIERRLNHVRKRVYSTSKKI